MKFVRTSSLIIGIAIILQWILFLSTNNVPEIETTPISISFHITIEIITGSVLILTFFVMRGARQWGRYLAVFSQGMLGYTVVNSAGYL